MESSSYVPEEEEQLFSEEMDFTLDAFMRSKKALVEWDNKVPCNFEKDGFISDKVVAKSMDFVDLRFPNLFRKSFHGSQPLDPYSCVLGSSSGKKVNSSACVIPLDSSLGGEETESKHSSSLVESRSHDSTLVDLKLGRLADCKGASSDKVAKEEFALTSIQTATLAKRARTSSSPSHTPVCQVYGCNKDLSSSKEYHKRHKVCDVHSKTAKVIVNGIEQRFCQQCSRFHLLAEFDDGKRSCRRRLAGHNERRRKPQFDYRSGKQHKILQSYEDTKYLGSSVQKRPQFAFEDIFRSGFSNSGKYGQISHSGRAKLEEEVTYTPQLAASSTHGQESSRFSNSSCALSLLSAQSRNPSCHSSGNPLDSSPVFQGICMHNNDDKVPEIPLGVSCVDKYVPNESFPCDLNSKEVIKNESTMLSDAGNALQLQVQMDNICQPPDLLTVKCQLSSEHEATVNLFQLSSHLQRVEHQRNSFLVKR